MRKTDGLLSTSCGRSPLMKLMIDGPRFYRSLLTTILIDKFVRVTIQYAAVAQFRVNACEKSFLFDGAAAGIESALLSERDFESLLSCEKYTNILQ